MNSQEFVQAVNEVVVDDSIKVVQSILEKPIGRAPSESSLLLSHWYNKLLDSDKKIVQAIVKEAVTTSVFGFFCVLDGVRAIENENKGVLKLFYENGDTSILLNNPNNDYLHDLM